ncbi:MAG: hypothetical protein JWM11_4550 [Planctomycetaceae bacterium]|nr:hypothetical protein [Planctomycetaceae bacterium]
MTDPGVEPSTGAKLPQGRFAQGDSLRKFALQTAAAPCDFSVVNSVPSPGVEPGLRPSQGRVHPPHSKDNWEKCSAEESNLVRQFRRLPCFQHTRRAI